MMDFRQRLKMATERGQHRREAQDRESAAAALSEEESRRVHSKHRTELSETIEKCLHQLADNFPGFQCQSVMDERGWGALATRDDLSIEKSGQRNSLYSRLEMVIRPFSEYRVLELVSKGTIRNKEIYNRSHFQLLNELDLDSFREMIDLWILEFAERFAAEG